MLSALYFCADYLGNQGRRAVLSCNPPSDAYDVRSIDWKHDGRPLTIQGPKHQKMANRLIITNIEPSDEGMYSCVVTDDSNTQTEVEVSCLFVLGESLNECMSGHTRKRLVMYAGYLIYHSRNLTDWPFRSHVQCT